MSTLFSKITGIQVKRAEPLARHTSFHIGGNADYFVTVYSLRALRRCLELIKTHHLDYYIIGAGTNLLVSDNGYRGVILRLAGLFRTMKMEKGALYCYSAMMIDDFLDKAAEKGYGGAEFLAGIPGTIGGGVKGNAGAFGRSFKDIVEMVVVADLDWGMREIKGKEIGFAYRGTRISNGTVIIGVRLAMKRRSRNVIQKELRAHRSYRWKKQPRGFSAGSFFKNPSSIPAGRLIDECGLKGTRVGDAMVSQQHANFIINCGHAKARDVCALADMIKKAVREKKGVFLKEEVKLLR
jgi:UDP-N-acetylmuramate dehydrogenase